MEGAIFQVYIQRIITNLECLLVCQLVATYEKNKTDSVHFQNLSIQNVDFSFLNKLGMAVYKVQRWITLQSHGKISSMTNNKAYHTVVEAINLKTID